jgi:hypothetical protein
MQVQENIMSAASRLLSSARKLGPYVLVELLLPGGTLIALILWLSQGMHRTGLMTVEQPILAPTQVEKMIAPVELQRGIGEHA